MALLTAPLQAFCAGFLGYGNPRAPLWYVALEEHGVANGVEAEAEAEVAARIAAWERRGRPAIDDMRAFCRETRHADLLPYARPDAPRQRTWYGLIEDQWQREGRTTFDSAEVLRHQQTEWLSANGNTCLVNLMPLPAAELASWRYDDWSEWSVLRDRDTYFSALAPSRASLLRNTIEHYQPEQVVFVGRSRKYQKYWAEIAAGLTGLRTEIIRHPAARGRRMNVPEKDFDTILHRLRVKQAPLRQHFEKLDLAANNPIFLSLIGGYGGPLCFEWKVPRYSAKDPQLNRALLAHLEGSLPTFISMVTETVGQPLQWQPRGKGGGTNAILVLRYADRPDAGESEAAWARRTYPLYTESIIRYADRGAG